MKTPVIVEREIRVNGNVVECEYCDKGYFLGAMSLSANVVDAEDASIHVELIPVSGAGNRVRARNPFYQDRIDAWLERNEHCAPKLIDVPGLGKCFVHMEVYAQ